MILGYNQAHPFVNNNTTNVIEHDHSALKCTAPQMVRASHCLTQTFFGDTCTQAVSHRLYFGILAHKHSLDIMQAYTKQQVQLNCFPANRCKSFVLNVAIMYSLLKCGKRLQLIRQNSQLVQQKVSRRTAVIESAFCFCSFLSSPSLHLGCPQPALLVVHCLHHA
jgi:hypothetical protein